MFPDYDIIVVGAGHAGCEAAASSARLGSSVLLITMNMSNMAHMSCNPAMGGVAKGQIIREIDALGGFSGIITDRTMIQFRMLNRSKGPAMWSPRAQSDRMLFSMEWRNELEKIANLDFLQDTVVGLDIRNNKLNRNYSRNPAEVFREWGNPTPVSIVNVRNVSQKPIIKLQNGHDFVLIEAFTELEGAIIPRF